MTWNQMVPLYELPFGTSCEPSGHMSDKDRKWTFLLMWLLAPIFFFAFFTRYMGTFGVVCSRI